MGLLRWMVWLPYKLLRGGRRERFRGSRMARTKHARPLPPGVVRIEVDNEMGGYHADAPAFSFWSASRIILILALLLWWIPPAGPMIAGFVGGRRAGSPIKAVIAALIPVFIILIVNFFYNANFARTQIDFVAALPLAIGDGVTGLVPFLQPYKEFMVAYLQTFVDALRTTFGMGTNGYLMVILFAYIGGLIAEQTRREIAYHGAPRSMGLNLWQPAPQWRPYVPEADDEYDDAVGAMPRHRRYPALAAGSRSSARGRLRRNRRYAHFEELEPVGAASEDVPLGRGGRRPRRREQEDVEVQEDHRRARPTNVRPAAHRETPTRESVPRETREPRPAKLRTRDEELAIQRFVERALRNYDKSKH